MFTRTSLLKGLFVIGLLSFAPGAIANETANTNCSGGSCLGGQESLETSTAGSSARATSSSAGTTVNQQHNTQYNNDAFYGFGPGIQCPTTGLGFSLYGGLGSGSGASNSVSSNSYGGMVTLNVPLGGRNAGTCSELGLAQLEAMQARVERESLESAKIRTDIYLVTIQQCINILQNATLSGQFADACQGVNLHTAQVNIPQPSASSYPQIAPIQNPVAPQKQGPFTQANEPNSDSGYLVAIPFSSSQPEMVPASHTPAPLVPTTPTAQIPPSTTPSSSPPSNGANLPMIALPTVGSRNNLPTIAGGNH
ncbi:hypothetical protein [Nodosilinea sp. E11]|uniref:hypothetical protein n=1 Tax=Nodosilinea sp. E11 TaxID=3037479 RepID=UPI002934B642|nr:hypothetical protein [Nodosilinea sp. E11]WOD37359.1 hypothetical protein RRF56_02475 [Nodosilinea sp. E11]